MAQNGELEEIGNAESAVGSSRPKHRRRRESALSRVVSKRWRLQEDPGFKEPDGGPSLEGAVNQEVELAIIKQSHLCDKKWDFGVGLYHPKSRILRLEFSGKLPDLVFTGMKIEGEGGIPIRVSLIDGLTEQVVSSGLEALAKVEIVVIEAELSGCEGDNWMPEDFNSKIVGEVEGKRSLLSGNILHILKEGIAYLHNVSFKHTSSYVAKCELRLGARIKVGSLGTRVREAWTEPFILKDGRYKYTKKNYPPNLDDKVWRLEKIRKDGAFHERLTKEKVYTVKDFLIKLSIEPSRLRNILGKAMTDRTWEATVGHAQTCILDSKCHLYCPGSQQKTGVVFNTVGQVMGLLSEFQYTPTSNPSKHEKDEAQNMVIEAFKNWDDVISFDDETPLMGGSLHLFNDTLYPNSTMVENSDGSKILASQNGGDDYPQESALPRGIFQSIDPSADPNSLDDCGLPDVLGNLEPDDGLHNFPDQLMDLLDWDGTDADTSAEAFCEDEHLQYFVTESESQVDGNTLHSFPTARCAAIPKRWVKLFFVMRWFIIRRIVLKRLY